MIDKNILKNGLNDRLKEIDEIVDKLMPNDYINELISKYSKELKNYQLIDSVEMFSVLELFGSMRYINRYDKKLRTGGLLIKIYQKNGQWFGIIKKPDNKSINKYYHISFNSNYIFYCKNNKEKDEDDFKDNLSVFLKDCEKGLYEII